MFGFGKGKKGPEVKEGEFDLKEIGERSGVEKKGWFPKIFSRKSEEIISLKIPSESNENYYDEKLEKYIKKGILLDGLLRKEFSMKEVNAFFDYYVRVFQEKYNDFESFSALVGNGKQAGAALFILLGNFESKIRK